MRSRVPTGKWVAEARVEVIGPEVFGERERAGVDDRGLALRVRADHRRQHRHRHVFRRARADRRLEGVVENVVAGADLVGAAEVVDDGERRGRADAARDLAELFTE